jgi:hypothetical protein
VDKITRVRTARAWAYKEQLREILERKQINMVRAMLTRWCTCVMRSKVEPISISTTSIYLHGDEVKRARQMSDAFAARPS